MQQERRLHAESLAFERHRWRASGAAFLVRVGSRAILAMTAATGLVLLVLGADRLFSLAAWLAVAACAAAAIAYLRTKYQREIRSSEEELRHARSLAERDQHAAEAHG